LPESPSGFEELTVTEFIKFSAASHGLSGIEYKQAVLLAIEDLQLKPLSKSRLADLSKGLRQRVWLAQALVHNPDILFLDEPTDGLDPIQKVALRRYILEISREKIVIMSTHILEEAEAMCGRLLVMNEGRIVKDGPTNDFLDGFGKLESSIIDYAS
jgi:ABC-2 type transport system ATP-binding protein